GRLDAVVVELTDMGDEGAGPLLVRDALDHLRARGARVAVDDVGARFGSLHRITVVRPDFVKLDGSVVAAVDRAEAEAGMGVTLAEFAGRSGARRLAEGIERSSRVDALVRLGVPFGRGFALGAPTPAMTEIDRGAVARVRVEPAPPAAAPR